MRRKDEVIKQALIEKQTIVENILNIPKADVENVIETASDLPVEKEPAEFILTAIGQGIVTALEVPIYKRNKMQNNDRYRNQILANQLIELLNSALTVSETDTVLATQSANVSSGCEATGCPAPRTHSRSSLEPAIPVSTLQPICNSLASQLSQLLVSHYKLLIC